MASCSLGLGLPSCQGAGTGFPSQPLYLGYNQHCSPDQTPSATLPEGEHIRKGFWRPWGRNWLWERSRGLRWRAGLGSRGDLRGNPGYSSGSNRPAWAPVLHGHFQVSVCVCVLPSLSLLAPCEGRLAIMQQPGGMVLKVNCIKHVWCSAQDWKHTASR